MFMLVHKWNAQDEITVMKETMAAVKSKWPEGVKLHASYNSLTHGAFCLWEAPDKKTLEKVFEVAPVLKKGTEFVSVCQSIPPTMEFVEFLTNMIIKGASK